MSERVLLVDDDEDIVELITCVLNRAGYQAFSALSGTEALKMLRNLRPDLIEIEAIVGLPRLCQK